MAYGVEAFLVVEGIPPQAATAVGEPSLPNEFGLCDVPCVKIDIDGAGREPDLRMNPPVCIFPGTLLAMKTYTRTFEVTNVSDSDGVLTWAHQAHASLRDTITIEPQSTNMAPGESKMFTLSYTPQAVGDFELEVPCSVTNGPDGLSLRVSARVRGPKVKILDAEIDFGLIGVGRPRRESSASKIRPTSLRSGALTRTLTHRSLERRIGLPSAALDIAHPAGA